MNRKFLIIANWKMNPSTLDEAKKLFEVVKKIIHSRALDKIFSLAILKIVNPTALLRFGERWQFFYLDEKSFCFYRWQ